MSVTLYAKERWGVCKCGHYDWQHDNSVIVEDEYGGIPQARGEGHGRCNCEGCSCQQFTWVRYEKNPYLATKKKAKNQ